MVPHLRPVEWKNIDCSDYGQKSLNTFDVHDRLLHSSYRCLSPYWIYQLLYR